MTSDQPAANAPNPDHEWKLIIGGDRPAGGAGTYDVINPATEEVVGRAPGGDDRPGRRRRRCGRRGL
jgi:hypothetical protein